MNSKSNSSVVDNGSIGGSSENFAVGVGSDDGSMYNGSYDLVPELDSNSENFAVGVGSDDGSMYNGSDASVGNLLSPTNSIVSSSNSRITDSCNISSWNDSGRSITSNLQGMPRSRENGGLRPTAVLKKPDYFSHNNYGKGGSYNER